MQSRWIVAAVWLAGACGMAACAEDSYQPGGGDGGDDSGEGGADSQQSSSGQGGGGAGGAGGDGGAGGAGGAGGTDAGSGGSQTPCGNGVIDPGESCDDPEFGGKTCESLGLGPGQLICNAACKIVVSGCAPIENCVDGQDNDQDFYADCEDSDCAGHPVCVDSCASPKYAIAPGYNSDDTGGHPSVNAASCSPGSGPELIYEVVAPTTGNLIFDLSSFGTDFSISVRTSCSDAATEIACSNSTVDGSEVLAIPVTQDSVYYFMIDGTGAQEYGYFNLSIDILFPESDCYDLTDDDSDDMVDCDDPTDCQTSMACVPGAGATGSLCFDQTDCSANANDPVCLNKMFKFPDGYCSEFCNLAAPDCSGDAICVDLDVSLSGVCLDGCMVDADCRPGYACLDKGYSSKVCMAGPETMCGDYMDNDFDTLMDCADPESCEASPDCVPGLSQTGAPCVKSSDCVANANDPLCVSDPNYSWPQGYCSQFCDLGMNDCGLGAICVDYFGFASGHGTCLDLCTNQSDCRTGYFCESLGFGPKACTAF